MWVKMYNFRLSSIHGQPFPPGILVQTIEHSLQLVWPICSKTVTPGLCSARFMLHSEPEVGWVSWRSIWSLCQFSCSCIWARQRRTRSYTLFAPSDLVRCTPGSRLLYIGQCMSALKGYEALSYASRHSTFTFSTIRTIRIIRSTWQHENHHFSSNILPR